MQSGFSNMGHKYVYACKFVNFDISDVSVNTNIVTANNNNVKHLSNICQQLFCY